MRESIFWIIIAIIIIGFLIDQVLNYLSDKGWDIPLPDFIKSSYTESLYEKARNYHHASDRLALIKSSISLVILLAILFLHGFDYYDQWVRSVTPNASLQMLLFFGGLFLDLSMGGLIRFFHFYGLILYQTLIAYF